MSQLIEKYSKLSLMFFEILTDKWYEPYNACDNWKKHDKEIHFPPSMRLTTWVGVVKNEE